MDLEWIGIGELAFFSSSWSFRVGSNNLETTLLTPTGRYHARTYARTYARTHRVIKVHDVARIHGKMHGSWPSRWVIAIHDIALLRMRVH